MFKMLLVQELAGGNVNKGIGIFTDQILHEKNYTPNFCL
jgi:hypothetical protein